MLEEDSSKASFIEQLLKFEQESFYHWTTLIVNTSSIGIPVRSLLEGRQTSKTGQTAQQNETTVRWYSINHL